MQTVYALFMCAVLNNQIQWDRCEPAPGSEGYFSSAAQCWDARADFALTFGGILRPLSECRRKADGTGECPFVQWKTRNSGPFNTTVTCVERDLPVLRQAPPP